MAHQQQKDFCLSIKKRFPEFFQSRLVLDVGSLDLNGNNQYLFDECGYIGIDLLPGKNVDIACKGHELQLPNATFDTIISTECFEHDPFYEQTILNINRMLKPGGVFLFSCATTGRPEHGTRRTTPHDAPFTHEFGDWGDYYKNLEEADIRQAIDIDQTFRHYEFSIQHETHDLYFWGIKRGELATHSGYSFMLPDNPFRRLTQSAEDKYQQIESKLVTCVAARLEAEVRIERIEENLLIAKAQLITSENDRKTVRTQMAAILSSNSWTITAPLRFVGNFWRKLISSLRKM